MCEILHSLGQLLVIYMIVDFFLSRFGFDLSRKIGFGKYSYWAPYFLGFGLGIFLLVQTGDQCSGLFGQWN